jgi:hypothetical protein
MATETRTRRQAAAKKGQATKRGNAARRSASATRTSARRTRSSARSAATETTRHARTTTRHAARTATRRFDATAARLEALGRQAERALLIQVGAIATMRDAFTRTARRYSNVDNVARELHRFERRGERVVNPRRRAFARRRRTLEQDVRAVRRDVERQTNGLRSGAEDAVQRIAQLG